MDGCDKIVRLVRGADRRDELRRQPELRWLFFELTDACNLACLHCGSRCDGANKTYLPLADIVSVLDDVAAHVDPSSVMVVLTGGEPLLHPDFRDIALAIDDKGFKWGMTTNASLIDDECADWLFSMGHMATVSVSLDGLPEQHDRLRGRKGAFAQVVRGIAALQRHYPVMITTAFGKETIGSFEDIAALMKELGADPWRAVNIDPIGRALDHPDIMLTEREIGELVVLIRAARQRGENVVYGCAHYLLADNELEVRDWPFMCLAGTAVASIRANGNIVACLDIEDRDETVQGNLATTGFWEAWSNGFAAFRTPLWERCATCVACAERYVCDADAYHTLDWDEMKPRICAKRLFPDEGLG